MPIYKIKNKKTGKIKELFMGIGEMLEWEKSNPNFEVLCGAPMLHSGTGLGLKSARTDDSFKETLKQIDKANPGNTLSDYAKF